MAATVARSSIPWTIWLYLFLGITTAVLIACIPFCFFFQTDYLAQSMASAAESLENAVVAYTIRGIQLNYQ